MAPEITATGGGSSTTAGEVVTVSATELADLQARASQSSQNFERFKDADEERQAALERVAELEALNANPGNGGAGNDPRVTTLETTVKGLTDKLAMAEVLKVFPVIGGKEADFEAFRNAPENAGMSLATAAKAFVHEKGLLEPRREGLEPPTGGGHVPTPTGKLSSEDAAKLRNTNFRAYREALKAGRIEVE